MTAKVYGIGLSKTGTTSLYVALARLGYRSGTYRHMQGLQLRRWWEGDFSVDYLQHFDAVSDLPVGTWFRELDEAYAGSKFILTVRPVEAWLASVGRQFRANPHPNAFNRDTRLATYGVTVFHEARFRRVYEAHERAVRDWFADRPKQLLVLDLFSGEGWDELCGFLGQPVPEVDFPNVKPGFRVEDQPWYAHR